MATSRLRSDETWDQFVARAGGGAATLSEFDDVLEIVIDTLGTEIKAANHRIQTLEQRIAELEQRPSVDYKGTLENRRGELATHAGSLWYSAVRVPLFGSNPKKAIQQRAFWLCRHRCARSGG